MTTTITGLPNATTPLAGTERVPMDQSGATKDATTQDIANLAPGTDLTYTAATRLLASSTGADVTLPVAGADPGLMSAADKSKLDGVAAGATANSSDATLLARANHTGTQAANTITGLAGVATSGAYGDLSGRPTLGTAAPLDVAAAGDATSAQVVKGNDSRLSDARTPTAHNQAWSTITSTPTTRSGYGITDAAANGAIGSSGLTMSTARLLGRTTASSGAVEEISIAGTLTFSGGVLTGTGGSAGGSSGQVQFNSSGSFAGAAGLVIDPTTGRLTLASFLAGSAPSAPATGFTLYAGSGNALSWIGANGFTRTFDGTANTANRSYTLQDKTGTIAHVDDITATRAGALPVTFNSNTITYAATVDLDMSALNGTYRTIGLSGNLTLTTSNLAAGRSMVLRLICDATTRTLTFPTDWKFVGTKPANIAASKTAVLSLSFFGTAGTDGVAAYAVQS
jgi:hypothetical protein